MAKRQPAASEAEPDAPEPESADVFVPTERNGLGYLLASDGQPVFDDDTGESRYQYLARINAEARAEVLAELAASSADVLGQLAAAAGDEPPPEPPTNTTTEE